MQNTSDESLNLIFSSILNGFLKLNNFRKEVQELGENSSVVNATLSIYTMISSELLPTPTKSHYTFNLRDVSKVFQGLLMSKPIGFSSQDQFIRLWIHECSRVFHDRLISQQDRRWFTENIIKNLFINFKVLFYL